MAAWITQLPGGKFTIMQERQGLKGWYQTIGPVFETASEASEHARKKRIAVTPIDNVTRRRWSTAEKQTKTKELGSAILAQLDDLYAQHPSGITVQIIMAHFRAEYAQALEALRWLGYTGQAKWVYRGNDTRKFLFPNRVDTPPRSDLGVNQEKVLRALAQAANAEGTVAMGYRDIGRRAGLTANSVSGIVQALRNKGYLTLLTSGRTWGTPKTVVGNPNKPSTYQVNLTPDKRSPTPEMAEGETKRREEPWITMDDIFAAYKRSEDEGKAMERAMWEQAGVDPDTDLYPPEEAAARFETAIRACGNIPPVDDVERALRKQIADDLDKRRHERK